MSRRISSKLFSGAASEKSAQPILHHADLLPRLKRAKGQIEGIERMIEKRRWCPDIVLQLRAAQAALRAVETTILDRYLQCCVTKIADSGDEEARRAVIAELSALLKRNGGMA